MFEEVGKKTKEFYNFDLLIRIDLGIIIERNMD